MIEAVTVGAVTHTHTSIKYISHALKQKLRLKTGPPVFSLYLRAEIS